MTKIVITNYESIPPLTNIEILITDITSIDANYRTTIKIGSLITLKKERVKSYLYDPTPYTPEVTETHPSGKIEDRASDSNFLINHNS